jgi:hypothetical protein
MRIVSISGFVIVQNWGTALATAAQPPTDYILQLATLLATKGDPSISDIDDLMKRLYVSPEYHRITRVQEGESIQFIKESPLEDGSTEASILGATTVSSGVDATADLSLVNPEITSESGVSIPAPDITPNGRGAVPSIPPGVGHELEYIISTIDTLSHLLLVLNQIDSDLKAENYVEVIKELNEQFDPILAQLANEATSRLFTSETTAAKWKDAVWQLHLMVSNYESDTKGIAEWNKFKPQVMKALARLLDIAVVAKSTQTNTPPPAGTSNEQLKRQLQDELIETSCVCLGRCLFRICGSRNDVATTSAPTTTVPGDYQGPSDMIRKALELNLFIDGLVGQIRSIIEEVKNLDSSGPEGQARMENLKLRIALRITSLVKIALANDSLKDFHNKALKGQSLVLFGTLGGIKGWDSIKDTVAQILTAITADLNASKSSVV